jgi:Rhodopirellula transposase DDE domain
MRRTGGGRKPSHEVLPGLDAAFLQVLEHHPAGAPLNAAVKGTNLTRQEIVDYLATEQGLPLSVTVVKQLLRDHGFVRRKAQKRRRTGAGAQRDAQFPKIADLREGYTRRGNPLVSSDTKTKNCLGISLVPGLSLPRCRGNPLSMTFRV